MSGFLFVVRHALYFAMALCIGTIHGGAARIQAATISTETFAKLDDAAKRETLKRALADYLRETSNIRVKTRVVIYLTDLEGMIPKKNGIRRKQTQHEIEYRRIGSSFRYNMKWWTEKDPLKSLPDLDESVGYDADTGIQRGYGMNPLLRKTGQHHGSVSAIDRKSLFSRNERYGRFLDGHYLSAEEEYYVPGLLSHLREIKFENSSRDGEIATVRQARLPGANEPIGTIRVRLDPSRRFLVTRVDRDLKVGTVNSRLITDVRKARQVQGAWLPEEIVEVGISGGRSPGTGVVYETTLLDAELGTLTRKDLEITFPPNTSFIYDKTKSGR